MSKQPVIFRDLGSMDYKTAWDYQENLLQENVRIKSEIRSCESEMKSEMSETEGLPTANRQLSTTNYLLFVEHPPVYTLGKSGHIENVLLSEENLKAKGIEFFRTNRGGDITFHGPQQIVGYPILDLEKFYTDIGKYLRNIEEVIILTLKEYGIESGRSAGETGVWLDADKKGRERKICAIGVRSSRWITMHGFAFNVNTDLDYFNFIIPCGIQDKQVTSLQKELGRPLNFEEVKEKVKRNFEKVFDAELKTIDNKQ
ncbi:lipoyl(octanoyl) transferase LipB [Terrimonas pollutisoli]|uniref:lipoyl(octanoyl) transferase LipB n=1 Tax=Terrimonas pollutisoli TaxID=3034147 RepID=UPI0023ED05C6|nr:lipoyl(octanoyl) transferase LipB [Terrimonas sp. H1YJ31]